MGACDDARAERKAGLDKSDERRALEAEVTAAAPGTEAGAAEGARRGKAIGVARGEALSGTVDEKEAEAEDERSEEPKGTEDKREGADEEPAGKNGKESEKDEERRFGATAARAAEAGGTGEEHCDDDEGKEWTESLLPLSTSRRRNAT